MIRNSRFKKLNVEANRAKQNREHHKFFHKLPSTLNINIKEKKKFK